MAHQPMPSRETIYAPPSPASSFSPSFNTYNHLDTPVRQPSTASYSLTHPRSTRPTPSIAHAPVHPHATPSSNALSGPPSPNASRNSFDRRSVLSTPTIAPLSPQHGPPYRSSQDYQGLVGDDEMEKYPAGSFAYLPKSEFEGHDYRLSGGKAGLAPTHSANFNPRLKRRKWYARPPALLGFLFLFLVFATVLAVVVMAVTKIKANSVSDAASADAQASSGSPSSSDPLLSSVTALTSSIMSPSSATAAPSAVPRVPSLLPSAMQTSRIASGPSSVATTSLVSSQAAIPTASSTAAAPTPPVTEPSYIGGYVSTGALFTSSVVDDPVKSEYYCHIYTITDTVAGRTCQSFAADLGIALDALLSQNVNTCWNGGTDALIPGTALTFCQ